jgi:hypothetical protein
MSNWDRDSLRWAKNDGTAVGWDLPVGSVVRAEIVNAAPPAGFRVWQRTPALEAALFWREPHPIPLQVKGQDGGLVWSEDFNTAAVRRPRGKKFVFDPGVDRPRSVPLSVIPHTTVTRSGKRKAVLSATGKVLKLVGLKLELDQEHSRGITYDCTSAADPLVAVSVLGGEAAVAHLAQLMFDEILEYQAPVFEIGEGPLKRQTIERFSQNVRRRFSVADNSPASVSIEGEDEFRVDVLSPRSVTIRLEGQRPGLGLFAVQATTVEGDTRESASVSDVTLFEFSDAGDTVTLYDGFVDEAAFDEAYVYAEDETELTLNGTPIVDATTENFATGEEFYERGEEFTTGEEENA